MAIPKCHGLQLRTSLSAGQLDNNCYCLRNKGAPISSKIHTIFPSEHFSELDFLYEFFILYVSQVLETGWVTAKLKRKEKWMQLCIAFCVHLQPLKWDICSIWY